MFSSSTQEKAYLAPFLGFFAVAGLGAILSHLFDGYAFWVVSQPQYWVMPLQTIFCGGLLLWGWRWYEMRLPARPLFASFIGIVALVIWVAPQMWFGAAPRLEGFEPGFFGADGLPYALNLGMRFIRLVIVVPLLEEIFWRGFLLRYLVSERFTSVPFGTFTWKSFGIVTAGFCLEHSFADWPAAIITGVLYNIVAYRTRSLSACVLTHAVTNLVLGFYILRTGQWGFW